MKSFYTTIRAHVLRVKPDEFNNPPRKVITRSVPRAPLLAEIGDLYIHTDPKFKQSCAAGRPVASHR